MRKGNKCRTYSHTDPATGKSIYKAKRKFLTPEQAIHAAEVTNSHFNQIHKAVPYKCTNCHFFHIGRDSEILKNK